MSSILPIAIIIGLFSLFFINNLKLMREDKYRTGLKRLLAAIVDGIVFMPLLLVDKWLYSSNHNPTLLTIWLIFTSFLPILYSIILHYKYGYTIGKWVARVKVLDVSETHTLTLKQSIMRDIVLLLVQAIGLFYILVYVIQNNGGSFISDYDDFAGMPLFIWTIAELISMITNAKRRAIHDLIAKSVVVRE
jgi:uncharacterized RDD family membrane protein YckC